VDVLACSQVSGHAGAGHVAADLEKMLQQREERLDFLLDEGMFVMQGVVPGVDDPVIYIGVVEKGWTTVRLSVSGEQSHSSAPPRESTIGILANAVAKLENERSPARFKSGPEYDTFAYLATRFISVQDDSLQPLASLRRSLVRPLSKLRDGRDPKNHHCCHHVQRWSQRERDAKFCRGGRQPQDSSDRDGGRCCEA